MAENFTVPSVNNLDDQSEFNAPDLPSIDATAPRPVAQTQKPDASQDQTPKALDPQIQSLIDSLDVPGEENKKPNSSPNGKDPVRRYQVKNPAQQTPTQQISAPADWFMRGVKNLPVDVLHQGASIYDAIAHPIDSGSWEAVKNLATGVDSYGRQLGGLSYNPEDQKFLNAFMDSYKDKYGSVEGFKQAWMEHPAGIALDAATIAAPVEGVLGRAGSMVRAAGDVASSVGLGAVGTGLKGAGQAVTGAGKVAGTVGKMVNPFDPLGAVSGTIGKIAPTTTKVVDRAGNLRSDIASTIMNDHGVDFSNLPSDSQSAIIKTLSTKGVNDATIRDALGNASGIQLGRQATTGVRSSSELGPQITALQAENNASLAQNATELAGGISEPDPVALGKALGQNYVDSYNNAGAGYDLIRQTNATLKSPIPQADVIASIDKRLAAAGLPNTAALSGVGRNLEAFPQANSALKTAVDVLSNNVKAYGGTSADAAEFMHVRQLMNDNAMTASNRDIPAVRAIIDGYHDAIGDAGKAGLIQDSAGNPVTTLSKAMRDTNDAYALHHRIYGASQISPAIDTLKDSLVRDTGTGAVSLPADDSVFQKMQAQLQGNLLNPSAGNLTYNQIKNGLGADSDVLDDHLKSLVFQNDGKNLTPVKSISSPIISKTGVARPLLYDDSSVISKAFANDPEALEQARALHATNKINNSKPSSGGPNSLAKEMASALTGKVAAGTLGYLAGHTPGMLLGEMVEPVAGAISRRVKLSKELSGAPKPARVLGKLGAIPRAAISRYGVGAGNIISSAAYLNQPAQQQTPNVSANDIDNATRMVLAEAGNQPDVGKLAVMYTALNRAQKSGESISDVINRPAAFESVSQGKTKDIDPNSPVYKYVRDNIVIPSLSGKTKDPTNGATYFLNKELQTSEGRPIPSWAQGKGLQIGAQTFYTGDYKASGGRVGRASGGAVNHASEADRLVALADKAKKSHNSQTKPLLSVPDEAITHALAIANESV